MAQIPDTSIKTVSPVGDVTPADVAEFRRGSQIDLSGEEFRHMEASRWDGQERGFSSADQSGFIPETAPPLQQDQPAYQPEPEPDFRQKYGQALNDMGEWRRTAQEREAQLQQLQQQMFELTNRLTQQQMQPQVQQAPPPGPPQRVFPDRQPGELLTWGELEEVLVNRLIPEIVDRTQIATYQAKDMAAAETQRMLPSWDVTPQEETQALHSLRSQFYNFDNRFTAVERNAFLKKEVALLRQARAQTTGQPPQAMPVGRVAGSSGAPAAPIVVDPSRAIRRATYVETAAPSQMSEPAPAASPNDQFKAELARLDAEARSQGKPRATAAQVKELLNRFGIGEANDWGGGTLTR